MKMDYVSYQQPLTSHLYNIAKIFFQWDPPLIPVRFGLVS